MHESLSVLARARNENVECFISKFSAEDLKRCPKKFSKHLAALRDANILSTEIVDGLAKVHLENNKVFYSPITHASLRKEWKYVADTIPGSVSEDTYLAAIDVVQRYLTDYAWPPGNLLSSNSCNIVELGAYLGHKTIRFAEEYALGGGGVLAVEMMPGNCEILKRTIRENNLSSVVDVKCVGVWNSSDSVEIYSKGRQRNSIVPISSLSSGEKYCIKAEPLNYILSQWGRKQIDLVFVSVNGAEVEILRGFDQNQANVRAFFIVSPYERNGYKCSDLCKAILSEKGYILSDGSNDSHVIAIKK